MKKKEKKKKVQLCTSKDIDLIAAIIVAKGSNALAAKTIGVKKNTLDKWIVANPAISKLINQYKEKIKAKAYTDAIRELKKKGREDLEQARRALLKLATGTDAYIKETQVFKNGKWLPSKRVVCKFSSNIEAIILYIRLFGDAEIRAAVDPPQQGINVTQTQGVLNIEQSQAFIKQMQEVGINAFPNVAEYKEIALEDKDE